MTRRLLSIAVLISLLFLLQGCSRNSEGNAMKFTFEPLQGETALGSSYFMDFGEMNAQEDAAIAEGKLISAFGQPAYTSESYEGSFNYVIRATADTGDSVILTVYGMGVVHIGAVRQDEFAQTAATALIQYVNSFKPADFSRTVYYWDMNMQIDISVKDGKAKIHESRISAEKINELFRNFFE